MEEYMDDYFDPELNSPDTDSPGPDTPEEPPPPTPPNGDLPDPQDLPPNYNWLMVSRLIDADPGQTEVDGSMATRLLDLMNGTFGEAGQNYPGYASEIHDVYGRYLTFYTLPQYQMDLVLASPFVFPEDIELPDRMQARLHRGENITIGELFNVLRI